MSGSNLGESPEGQSPYEPPLPSIPKGWIAIPRRVVFIQAFLLVAVGVNAFLCGMLFSRGSGSNDNMRPVIVRGQIRDASNGPARECLVMFLPVGAKPQSPFDFASIQNNSIPPNVADQLRSLGVAWASTDTNGNYQVGLNGPDEYQVFLLSSEQSNSNPTPPELAAIGQYFVPAFDLIHRRRYAWLRRDFKSDSSFDYRFEGNPAR